jgi:hypothetical protein
VPFAHRMDLTYTAGDRCNISLAVDVEDVGDIEGLDAELRVLDVGVLETTVANGACAFDPDDAAEILGIDPGEYTFSLILDPSGARRRTYATGTLTIELVEPE